MNGKNRVFPGFMADAITPLEHRECPYKGKTYSGITLSVNYFKNIFSLWGLRIRRYK